MHCQFGIERIVVGKGGVVDSDLYAAVGIFDDNGFAVFTQQIVCRDDTVHGQILGDTGRGAMTQRFQVADGAVAILSRVVKRQFGCGTA